jgi:hypothetical protein
MEVQVTDLEYDLMVEILQDRHAALLREIARTDHHDFRQMLKKRMQVLESLMEKMGINEAVR